MNIGLGYLALAELSRMENKAQGERIAGSGLGDRWAAHHDKFVFKATSQVHGLRSCIHGHKMAEDQLIAALKLENASHPLASREAVDAILDIEMPKALYNPDVIKKTFPDGVLLPGIVSPPDLVHQPL